MLAQGAVGLQTRFRASSLSKMHARVLSLGTKADFWSPSVRDVATLTEH
jgi:hypothetical protein